MAIVKFPLEFSKNKKVQLTTDTGAELDLLFFIPPKQRLFNKRYGIDLSLLQQGSTDPKVFIPVFSLELKEKLKKFTDNVNLIKANIYKKKDSRRVIYIDIYYNSYKGETFRTFEADF